MPRQQSCPPLVLLSVHAEIAKKITEKSKRDTKVCEQVIELCIRAHIFTPFNQTNEGQVCRETPQIEEAV